MLDLSQTFIRISRLDALLEAFDSLLELRGRVTRQDRLAESCLPDVVELLALLRRLARISSNCRFMSARNSRRRIGTMSSGSAMTRLSCSALHAAARSATGSACALNPKRWQMA